MKNQLLLSILFSLFSILLFGQSSGDFGAPKYAPEDGKQLLILGQDLGAVGGLDAYTDGYVDNVEGHIPAGVTTYTSIPSLGGLATQANWGSGDVNGQTYLEDETFDNSVISIGLYLVNELGNIAAGNHDNSIRTLATWIKGSNRPVFLRIGYEFDGPWNGYNAAQYITAYRHIVGIFDVEEVCNVAYVWQSAGINTASIQNWYPGDEYVNWLGYSHFDGPNPGQRMRDFAEEKNKPIMIAEATPRRDLGVGDGQNHWDAWFAGLFSSVYESDKIKALAYINVDWDSQPMWNGQGWGDSRVQVNETILNNWISEIENGTWLTANDTIFEQLAYDPSAQCTAVSTKEISWQPQLIVKQNTEGIYISTKDFQTLDGLSIFDLNGRLLYENKSAKSEYFYQHNSNSILPIVITIKKEGQIYSQKDTILLNR